MSDKEEELQKIIYTLELHRSQLATLGKQLEIIEASRTENLRARETLVNYEKLSEKDVTLVPIGGDVFVLGIAGSNKRVITSIGSNVALETDIPEAIEKIDKRVEEFEDVEKKIATRMQTLQNEMDKLSRKAQEIYKEAKDVQSAERQVENISKKG